MSLILIPTFTVAFVRLCFPEVTEILGFILWMLMYVAVLLGHINNQLGKIKDYLL